MRLTTCNQSYYYARGNQFSFPYASIIRLTFRVHFVRNIGCSGTPGRRNWIPFYTLACLIYIGQCALLSRETRIISWLERLVEYSYPCPVSYDALKATPRFHTRCTPTANYGLILTTLGLELSAYTLPSFPVVRASQPNAEYLGHIHPPPPS